MSHPDDHQTTSKNIRILSCQQTSTQAVASRNKSRTLKSWIFVSSPCLSSSALFITLAAVSRNSTQPSVYTPNFIATLFTNALESDSYPRPGHSSRAVPASCAEARNGAAGYAAVEDDAAVDVSASYDAAKHGASKLLANPGPYAAAHSQRIDLYPSSELSHARAI